MAAILNSTNGRTARQDVEMRVPRFDLVNVAVVSIVHWAKFVVDVSDSNARESRGRRSAVDISASRLVAAYFLARRHSSATVAHIERVVLALVRGAVPVDVSARRTVAADVLELLS
jgi:hypothetical protein